MITIFRTKIEVKDSTHFFKRIRQNTTPLINLHFLMPVKYGQNTVKEFGGKEISEQEYKVTRSKYSLFRCTPKHIVHLTLKDGDVHLVFKPAIFTFLLILLFVLSLIVVVCNYNRFDLWDTASKLSFCGVFGFLNYIEIKTYLKKFKALEANQ